MKTIRIIIALFALTFFGCDEEPHVLSPLVPYTIEMQKINGEWIEEKYFLPEDALLYIDSHGGSYWLKFKSESRHARGSQAKVRAGIIDFKIVE